MTAVFDDRLSDGSKEVSSSAVNRLMESTFTIECPLPSGAVAFRTYWRDGGVLCGGVSLPWQQDDPIAAMAATPVDILLRFSPRERMMLRVKEDGEVFL